MGLGAMQDGENAVDEDTILVRQMTAALERAGCYSDNARKLLARVFPMQDADRAAALLQEAAGCIQASQAAIAGYHSDRELLRLRRGGS